MPRRTKPALDLLLQFGCDLTQKARDGKLFPLVGRESEVQKISETLCCSFKRNPLLVGPSGVGKTAIVEGFAQQVAAGRVSGELKGATVILLQPMLLVAGSGVTGVLEARVAKIIEEASQEGIILFIDELHTIVGAGGTSGAADLASFMKPALARGEIACIGATTDEEYRRFIEHDPTLARRFQKVAVHEMLPARVLEVLISQRETFRRTRGVDVPELLLRRIMHYVDKFMHRKFSLVDKSVTLLDRCVANAKVQCAAEVDFATFQAVAQEEIGIPLDLGRRIAAMRQDLLERNLLPEPALLRLVERLKVTMPGFDMCKERPNAVILLTGEAAGHGRALAESVCRSLLGTLDRLVQVELGSSPDVTQLLGAPPGYIGHGGRLPIHRIQDIPWCVVLLEAVDSSHHNIQTVLGQALKNGYFTDGQNNRIWLSDAVIVMTAPDLRKNSAAIGFHFAGSDTEYLRDLVCRQLSPAIAECADLICDYTASPEVLRDERQWLERELLARLAEKFEGYGVELRWDDSFLVWLKDLGVAQRPVHEQETFLDEEVTPAVVTCIGECCGEDRTVLLQTRLDGIHAQLCCSC